MSQQTKGSNGTNEDFEWEVTTLAGAKPEVIKHLSQFDPEEKYQKRWKKSKVVAYLMHGLGAFDRLRFNYLKKNKDLEMYPPVFIIGHWRSGTTLMHNILCDVTDASYCTTYQNVFPNNMFAFYNLLRSQVQKRLPDERPADQVEMHTLYPQEEEFALGNTYPFSFYYWMFFPQHTDEFRQQFLLQEDVSDKEIKAWKRNYRNFVKRCLLRVKGKQFISKNPPHTARVEQLLELYPKSKFIFLHRNIYDTLSSTKRFFSKVILAQQHQAISDQELEEEVFNTYEALHKRYFNTKSLIPNDQLVEIAYEDFVQDPIQTAENTLEELKVNYEITQEVRDHYERSKRKASNYDHAPDFIKKVNTKLHPFFKKLGYRQLQPTND